MLIEPWLLLHAAELARQATDQVAALVGSVEHEAHAFLEEITDAVNPAGWINGGCHEE